MKILPPLKCEILIKNLSQFLPDFLFTILCLSPFFLSFERSATWPQWGFSIVYFMALHYPERLHWGWIFGMTLLQDSLWEMPFGFLGCTFYTLSLIIQSFGRRFHHRTFVSTWFGFGVFYILLISIKNAILWTLGRPLMLVNSGNEWLIAILGYPGFAALQSRLYKNLI